MSPPVAVGSSRYRRHTPRSRSLTIAVGMPKHAPPSTVTVSSCPISCTSGGLLVLKHAPEREQEKDREHVPVNQRLLAAEVEPEGEEKVMEKAVHDNCVTLSGPILRYGDRRTGMFDSPVVGQSEIVVRALVCFSTGGLKPAPQTAPLPIPSSCQPGRDRERLVIFAPGN